jgi:hypothetical protein
VSGPTSDLTPPPDLEIGSAALCDGALWHLDGLLGVRQGARCRLDRRLITVEFDHHVRTEVDLVLPRHGFFAGGAPLPLPTPDRGPGPRGLLGRIRDFLVGPPQTRLSAGGHCAWVRFEAEALAVRLGHGADLDLDSSLFHALRVGGPDPGLRALLLALVAWQRNPRSGLIEIDWHDPVRTPVAKLAREVPERWSHAWGQLESELPADRISLLLKGEWEPLHGLEERRRRCEAAVVAKSVEAILIPQPVLL